MSPVVTPDDDPNFRRMKEQYAEQYLTVRQEEIRCKEAEAAAERRAVEAYTDARMKILGAQGEAEALKIQKAAEAEAYRMQAEAEAQEMRMKGYSYQQETARQVGMEAMKNGIAGEGSGGLGEIAGLGVTLGAMGGVMNLTKEALNPVLNCAENAGRTVSAAISDSWDCTCGQKAVTSNFCPNCRCETTPPSCGGNLGLYLRREGYFQQFLPQRGAKRPAPSQQKLELLLRAAGNIWKFLSQRGKREGKADGHRTQHIQIIYNGIIAVLPGKHEKTA